MIYFLVIAILICPEHIQVYRLARQIVPIMLASQTLEEMEQPFGHQIFHQIITLLR